MEKESECNENKELYEKDVKRGSFKTNLLLQLRS